MILADDYATFIRDGGGQQDFYVLYAKYAR